MPRLKKRYVVNFPAHLADCEFNYLRLMRLMPSWRSEEENSACQEKNQDKKEWRYIVGQHNNSEMAVLLNVLEAAKYTTTVHIEVHSRFRNQMSWSHYLRYSLEKKQSSLSKPQISMADILGSVTMLLNRFKSYSFEVRLYHDATVAEVIAWEGNRRFRARHDYPNPRMYHSDEKAQLNRFLGELLELCLTQGRILDDVTITI